MSQNLKENVTRSSIWLRLISMIVLAIAFNVAEIVIFAVVIFQFLVTLFTGKPNSQLRQFGSNLARYIQQITSFMTFGTEEKPFPFSSWPDEPQQEPFVSEVKETQAEKTEKAETVSEPRKATSPRRPAPRRTPAKAKPKAPAKTAAKKPAKATTKKKT